MFAPIVTNPIVSVTNANDDYIQNTVATTSSFTSDKENYEFSRPTGIFDYVETWDDEDVKKCVETWIEHFLRKLEEDYNEKDCYICSNIVPEEGIILRKEKTFKYEAYKLKSKRFLLGESDNIEQVNIEDNQ